MKNKIYVFIVILSGVFWGSSCLFVDYLKTHTPATSVQITAIRIVFAAIVLNLWLIIKGKGFSLYKISGRSWLLCAVSGIGSVLAMGMFYYSCPLATPTILFGVSLTLGMRYLFTPALAKHSRCFLPWTKGISSPPPFLTFNVG